MYASIDRFRRFRAAGCHVGGGRLRDPEQLEQFNAESVDAFAILVRRLVFVLPLVALLIGRVAFVFVFAFPVVGKFVLVLLQLLVRFIGWLGSPDLAIGIRGRSAGLAQHVAGFAGRRDVDDGQPWHRRTKP